jgi:hypothetical protein
MCRYPNQNTFILWTVLFGLVISACSASPQALTPTPTASLTPALTAYHTPTASLTPSGQPPTATPLPTATATLLKYTVGKDDDMFGLSLYFGIDVHAIETANPSVHPNSMGEGTVLIIPLTPTPPTPTASPAPGQVPASGVSVTAPRCYSDAKGGLWCLALVRNQGAASLENVSVIFRLTSEQTVYTPLDVLAKGAALPVAAYFDPPAAASAQVEAQPAGSLPLAAGDPRYTALQPIGIETKVDGMSAAVSGKLAPSAVSGSAKSAWVLAVAYDVDGNPVGLRKWESGEIAQGITATNPLPFSLTVYDLGPAIDHVDVLAEGHN